MKYTQEVHIKQLRKLLEKPEPCELCPAKIGNPKIIRMFLGCRNLEYLKICSICRKFVGLKSSSKYIESLNKKCPCHVLGKEEALRRTIEALEEYE